MANYSYQNIVEIILKIAENHGSFKAVESGDIFEREKSLKSSYPLFFLHYQDNVSEENYLTYNFELYATDTVLPGKGNELQVLSNCQKWLNDIVNYLRRLDLPLIELEFGNNSSPITKGLISGGAGWVYSLSLKTPYDINSCDTPIDTITLPPIQERQIIYENVLGYQGPQGNSGSIGNTGFQGAVGNTGNQGNTGATGHQGYQGFQGLVGETGFQGDIGFQGNQGFQGFIGTTGGFGLTYSGINTQLAYFNSTTGLTSSSQMIFDGTNLIIGTGTSIIGGTSTGSILTLHATSASSSTALSNAFIFKYTPSIEAMRLGGNLTGTETYVCFNGTSNLSGGSANYFIRTGTNAGGFVYMNALSDFRLKVADTDYIIMTSGTGIISARKPLTMFTAMKLTLAAGTTTVQPLLFQSGTNLTTGVAGSMEYNGTNFFLTRTGTTREGILTVSATSSVSPTSPNLTLTVNIGGQTYYIPAKTTND